MKTSGVMELVAYIWPLLPFLVPPAASLPTEENGGDDSNGNYGILLDAGSSSTKLKIYRWSPPHSRMSVPTVDLTSDKRVSPALRHFLHDIPGLTAYLDEMLTTAKENIPEEKHAYTPVYIMATAGLRFLAPATAVQLMEDTRAVLANRSVNPFDFKPSNVRILSGEEEGVYSWIAANYLLGFFDTYNPLNQSVGVLEMGGGSTQITFIPSGPLYSEEFQATVAGRKYELYVQSYLQYGTNAIREKVEHALFNLYPGQSVVENPCMLRDDEDVQEVEGVQLTLQGSGDPQECEELLEGILRPNTGIDCQPKPCAIGSVYQPSVSNLTFYATQAFGYAPKSLKAIGPDNVLHIDQLRDAGYKHCDQTLNQALKKAGISKKYASADCLMGLYIPTLLTLSYGFSENTTNIKVTSEIDSKRIDWALGAMLVELSAIFSDRNAIYSVTCKTPTALGGKNFGQQPVYGENSASVLSLPGVIPFSVLYFFWLIAFGTF